MSQKGILIVEDEENLLEALRYRFSQEGYRVTVAKDGLEALDAARAHPPDLVLLDLMLPHMDGLEVCRILRKETIVPILILTARADDVEKVVGLEIGADDYVTKPFNMRELLARIKALLRRADLTQEARSTGATNLTVAHLRVDLAAHRAWKDDKPLDLKPREFELLAFFMQNRGRAFTREHLLDRVWGYETVVDTRTVDVHVRWIREKIELDPAHPALLVTVRGIGYRFEG